MRLRRRPEGAPPVRRILVGTDRSETATRAVRWAAEMAERFEAELVVTQSVKDHEETAATERELERYVAEVVGPNARTIVREAKDPAREMVEIADEEDIDVIVVGSVGMSGRKEFLLENIPNRVSHLARCTVVIVQTQPDGARR
jgi:nucleotide-binding universal stress UspA family protein